MVEKGSLESSKNEDAYCLVEGQTTIIMIKPEGTPVKKGELVCELDSAALKDQLVNQKITTKSAEANYENAKLTREVAEIAVVEYEEGIYKQDLATVEGEIKLAESDLSRSEDRLDWARRMFEKGYVSKATKVSEELTLKKARFALEQAAEQEEGAGRLHQGQDDQGAQERGREGPIRRAGQEGDLGAGRRQGKEAREADRQLRHSWPRPTAWSSTPTIPAGRSAATSPRSRKGRRSASGRRSSACRTSRKCRSTPRSTSRRSTSSPGA